jgi:hypothetical protein
MADKYFERDEAEKLLPKLEAWLKEARRQKQLMDALDQEILRQVSRIAMLGGSLAPYAEIAQQRARREQQATKVMESVEKIQQSGCQVKDLDEGVIDFPSLKAGEEIYLCWKLGEKHIEHWHGIDEGFAGRQRLDEFPGEHPPPDKPGIQ